MEDSKMEVIAKLNEVIDEVSNTPEGTETGVITITLRYEDVKVEGEEDFSLLQLTANNVFPSHLIMGVRAIASTLISNSPNHTIEIEHDLLEAIKDGIQDAEEKQKEEKQDGKND